ncbi:MAG: PQQ-dependent sugar dehydrogenase [Pseudomonadota bacterium]
MARAAGAYIAFLACLALAGEPAAYAEFGLSSRPANTHCVTAPRPVAQRALDVERMEIGSIPDIMFMDQHEQSRWFFLTRIGEVFLDSDITAPGNDGVVLDLTDRVITTFDGNPAEFGALGLATDPNFAASGFLYVYYVMDNAGPVARLSRFYSDDRTTFDIATEEVLIELALVTGIHVGSTVSFGPDGYLYLGTGDGGVFEAGGPDLAQDVTSLMGKMLRLHVTDAPGYQIPPDNPFADGVGGAPEVFAWGLRNPFRWNFDSETGDLWLGDMGSSQFEEINIIVKSGNYGWSIREGAACRESEPCDATGLIDPVHAYPHADGLNAVNAGTVYRGSALEGYEGAFFFSDIYNDVRTLTLSDAGDYVSRSALDISFLCVTTTDNGPGTATSGTTKGPRRFCWRTQKTRRWEVRSGITPAGMSVSNATRK